MAQACWNRLGPEIGGFGPGERGSTDFITLLRSEPSRRTRPELRIRGDVRETRSFQGLGTTAYSRCLRSPTDAPYPSRKRLRSQLQRPLWRNRCLGIGEVSRRRFLVPRMFPGQRLVRSTRSGWFRSAGEYRGVRSHLAAPVRSAQPFAARLPRATARYHPRVHEGVRDCTQRHPSCAVAMTTAPCRSRRPSFGSVGPSNATCPASGRCAPSIRLPSWPWPRSGQGWHPSPAAAMLGGTRTLVRRVTALQLDEAKEPCEMIERRCDLDPVVVPGFPPSFRS